MEPVYFVMAILGCGDDGLQCREQRVEPARYTSIAACQLAISTALARNTDISFPVVGAQCQAVSTRMVDGRRAVDGKAPS